MDLIFKNIDQDKRDRIINSSFEVFAKNGFEKASTNEIVKKANISKGILFHYFGNKQNLYDKLKRFSVDIINQELEENIDWNERDFFERVKNGVIIKANIVNKYPYIFEFIKVFFDGLSMDEMKEIIGEETMQLKHKIYTENIDFSLFKDDLDMDVTMNIINWTFENMSKKVWDEATEKDIDLDIEFMKKESDIYIKALKKAFYKEVED